jgi:nucleotide-binding universal stress UspA family protein
MYRHILIPTDGSELAHHAVKHGLALASSVGAKVTFLVVEPTFDVFSVVPSKIDQMPGEFAEYGKHAKAHAALILSAVAAEAKAVRVPCETRQKTHNQPYEAIVEMAQQKGCDLIVMASHGRSGIAAVILGSVTTKVLTHSTVPVLVCH